MYLEHNKESKHKLRDIGYGANRQSQCQKFFEGQGDQLLQWYVLNNQDKYVEQVKMLKYENSKFTDRLFPPGSASLCYSKDKMGKLREVKWMRIEDVFKGKKLTIYNR